MSATAAKANESVSMVTLSKDSYGVYEPYQGEGSERMGTSTYALRKASFYGRSGVTAEDCDRAPG
jgi:hypothetical protein